MTYITLSALESLAAMYFDGYTADIVVDDVNRWYLAGGNTTAFASNTSDWTHTPGRLTYNGTETVIFHIVVSLSLTNDANNLIHYFRILKNGGTRLASSQISRKVGTGADEGALPITGFVSMSTGDYIELIVRCNGTSTITIEHVTFTVIA